MGHLFLVWYWLQASLIKIWKVLTHLVLVSFLNLISDGVFPKAYFELTAVQQQILLIFLYFQSLFKNQISHFFIK